MSDSSFAPSAKFVETRAHRMLRSMIRSIDKDHGVEAVTEFVEELMDAVRLEPEKTNDQIVRDVILCADGKDESRAKR